MVFPSLLKMMMLHPSVDYKIRGVILSPLLLPLQGSFPPSTSAPQPMSFASSLLAPATKWLDAIHDSEINAINSKFALTEEDNMNEHTPTLSINSLRAIAAAPNTHLDFSEESIPTERIQIMINAIRSKAVTPAEQALGHFTRHKLKHLSTWRDWESGERKQLNQF